MTVAPDPVYLKIDRATNRDRSTPSHFRDAAMSDALSDLILEVADCVKVNPKHGPKSFGL
jgi:hypothetical protein